MAGSSLLALPDDIATLLDGILVMEKLAARKIAGALGDDLLLSAQQVSSMWTNHELPVVWGVAKRPFVNKVILVPLTLLIDASIPWAITPSLTIDEALLCFEGVEKILHTLEAWKHKETLEGCQQRLTSLATQDPLTLEKDKTKEVIHTDLTLSAEIVVITLGIVVDVLLLNQVLVLSSVALAVTVGVHGLVGTIVKPDDIGYWLVEKRSLLAQSLGRGLLVVAPWPMRTLSVVGTLATFLVGGGIVVHGMSPLHHAIERFAQQQSTLISPVPLILLSLVLDFIIGGIIVLLIKAVARVRGISH